MENDKKQPKISIIELKDKDGEEGCYMKLTPEDNQFFIQSMLNLRRLFTNSLQQASSLMMLDTIKIASEIEGKGLGDDSITNFMVALTGMQKSLVSYFHAYAYIISKIKVEDEDKKQQFINRFWDGIDKIMDAENIFQIGIDDDYKKIVIDKTKFKSAAEEFSDNIEKILRETKEANDRKLKDEKNND